MRALAHTHTHGGIRTAPGDLGLSSITSRIAHQQLTQLLVSAAADRNDAIIKHLGGAHGAPRTTEPSAPVEAASPLALVPHFTTPTHHEVSQQLSSAPAGVEHDAMLASLPTPPPPPMLARLPEPDELPPPLPPEALSSSPALPVMHDFSSLTMGAFGTVVGGGSGPVAAAKLAIPLLKDVQRLSNSHRATDVPQTGIGSDLATGTSNAVVDASHDRLRHSLLG